MTVIQGALVVEADVPAAALELVLLRAIITVQMDVLAAARMLVDKAVRAIAGLIA